MATNDRKSYLQKPEAFSGDRRKVNNFIYACDLFFEGSPTKDFPGDKDKIIFILSYMSEGEALMWRKDYIETKVKQADGSYTWPTKAQFLTAFRAAFLNEDEKGESLRKLDHINQGSRTAEEYINEFRLTVNKAGVPTNNDMITKTFRKGLNRALATRILYSDKKPDALEDTTMKKGWYTIAIEFDRIHRDNVQALNERPDKPMG
jgi:Retrotransposon gag protein